MSDELAAAVEAFHAALDEHDDSTWNHRSNDTVDGYAPNIVRALLAAGWEAPGNSSERRWADQYFAERNEARADLARVLPVVAAAEALVERWGSVPASWRDAACEKFDECADGGLGDLLDALARELDAGKERG